MKVVRSWPALMPEGGTRSYVVDDATRLLNSWSDYSGLVGLADDDIIQLDWDMAIGREDLQAFAARAKSNPGAVLVAPQRVDVGSRVGLEVPIWNMRRHEGEHLRYVYTEEPSCHLFGFGMVYLPAKLIKAFGETGLSFCDTHFSSWHYANVAQEAEIMWDVRPAHLHYKISQVPL